MGTAQIKLGEEDQGACNIATENSNHVHTKPWNQEISFLLLDSSNPKNVADEEGQKAKCFSPKQQRFLHDTFLCIIAISIIFVSFSIVSDSNKKLHQSNEIETNQKQKDKVTDLEFDIHRDEDTTTFPKHP